MPSDASKPLLRLTPNQQQQRRPGKPGVPPPPASFPRSRQEGAFAPKFDRLTDVLSRDPNGLELRGDPAALAPERLLVFEVRGTLPAFAEAVRRVPGLELVDEEELEADNEDKAPVAYLMVPDARALRELESLWRRYLRGEVVRGQAAWLSIFELLKDLRTWGPEDRVQPGDATLLEEEILDRPDDDLVRLEFELVFRLASATGQSREEEVRRAILDSGGQVLSTARIDDIAYHAVLADVPVSAVRRITQKAQDSLAGLEPVMHIRPQSTASSVETADPRDADAPATTPALGDPILALLDGVPVAGHALLRDHVVVEDEFGLEPNAPVADRLHGTAMASLIIHGDRNRAEPPLPRRIFVVPVLGESDAFPSDRLIVDVIYTAVLAMREGQSPKAPDVLIVNISLGNTRRPFQGQMSPWARLLDRLAYRLGILFVVSAGNHTWPFAISAYPNQLAFESADPDNRARETVRALGAIAADRRLLSPAETVNGLTVGACNQDAVSSTDRAAATYSVEPFVAHRMANPTSALGPGFAQSVKPDVLMPGARERLRLIRSHGHIEVGPAGPGRAAGLRVAAPPRGGRENQEAFTNGTSAAAALASRTAHRIHDALERAYGNMFLGLDPRSRAVLLKALLAHTARWPDDTPTLIRDVLGPAGGQNHVRQRDNIRRFLGFGVVDSEEAVACAADRATFWATGVLQPNRMAEVDVPLPLGISGKAQPHALAATLAWFTPTAPGRKSYRSVRLQIHEPSSLNVLGVAAAKEQPDANQVRRGTVFTRWWTGDQAPAVSPNGNFTLQIQRDPDRGAVIDDPIPFGLAITLTMPGVTSIYDEVRFRLGLAVQATP